MSARPPPVGPSATDQNQWPALRTAVELLHDADPGLARRLARGLGEHPGAAPAYGEQARRLELLLEGDDDAGTSAIGWSAERLVAEALGGLAAMAASGG